MATNRSARQLITEVSDLVLDIEDVLVGGGLPADLLQPLADDLAPMRDRLRRHLANLVRAKQDKLPQPAAPTRKQAAKRPCSAAARR